MQARANNRYRKAVSEFLKKTKNIAFTTQYFLGSSFHLRKSKSRSRLANLIIPLETVAALGSSKRLETIVVGAGCCLSKARFLALLTRGGWILGSGLLPCKAR
jgi:hypothetical protein